ncbi:ABC transporter ATP-binding protein [Ilumatobacter sp.]|uniref:ABC transporter ATP-binding protein n=1 Tax=Ilumatobacter sp. TaxID=1967498 RepID=UPI003B5260AB
MTSAGLRVAGLRKRYGDVVAVDGCDLHVEPGGLVGFLGPNGAGKSTTMRAVMGLVSTDGGEITWNGAAIDGAVRRRFGYMPQERGLYDRMRVHEQVAYFGRLGGLDGRRAQARSDALLARVGLSHRHDSELQELSVGNQQRVQLAVALVHEPELLVLDEPFAGLDPFAIDALREIITEQTERGVAVLLSSHQLDLVQEMCREVVIVDEGRVVESGPASEIRTRSSWRELEISWGDESVDVGTWSPPGARLVARGPGRCVFRLPAEADPTALMGSAAALGAVVSFRFEPPSLDVVFTEAVSRGRADRADRVDDSQRVRAHDREVAT